MKMLIVRTNGKCEHVDNTGLMSMQDAVGGYIEHVAINSEVSMFVNEEGRLLELPINHFATLVFASAYQTHDTIHGDVVFTGATDDEGNETDVPETVVAHFIEKMKSVEPKCTIMGFAPRGSASDEE